MRAFHSIWTLLLAVAVPAAAQQAAPPATPPDTHAYTVFLRGVPIGRQDITVRSNAQGLTITGQGQIAAPFDVLTRKAEIHYRPDQSAESLVIDSRINGMDVQLHTTFDNARATSQGSQGTSPISATDPVVAGEFVLPGVFLGSQAVLARRLAGVAPGTEFKAFVGPGVSQQPFRLRSEKTEKAQTGTSTFDVHHYELVFDATPAPLLMHVYADDLGGLVRVEIPSQGLDLLRDDLASAITRMRIAANPGDEAVSIPANGFNLGATLTRPSGASGKLPALILIGDTEDRDGTVFGVAVMAQVASAAANAGFLAVRYDRRGSGQSGGRPESATIPDLAEDVRAIARWLGDRKDIDPKRIAVLGHGQGAWVAQLASARERKIAALITVNSPSTTGADLALEQQQRMLDRLQLSASERERRVSLQKQIQNAVLTGKGWEGIPPDVRRQSDTAWTQSVLAFNPAVALDDVRQPMLLVHAELDRQVPASHVEHLAELARKESRSKSIDVVTVKGVNHLLVPAITGEEDEYATLGDPNVSKDVTGAVTTWLSRTLGPASRQ